MTAVGADMVNGGAVGDDGDSESAAARRARREAIVREHMQSENDLDFDRTMATFAHPRYELIGTGGVFDGEDEVRRYFAMSRTPFPDQRNEVIALHHSDDAVFAEFVLKGTFTRPLGDIEPTGLPFECRMLAMFVFGDRPEDTSQEGIVCERVYFDQATIMRQIGVSPR